MRSKRAVFDANAFIATVLPLPYSAAAKWAAQSYEQVAPDICAFEVVSGLGKAVRASMLSVDDAADAIAQMRALFDFAPSLPLLSPAHEMGLRLAHSPHDCAYLALAEREGVPFITNDQRFLRKLVGIARTPLVNLSDMPETLP